MGFINPDPTFAHQADRVYAFYQKVADIRDKYACGDTDARRVNLNNVVMAANAATATLRMMHWAKQGGDGLMIQALGLEKPEYINLVAEDVLRSSRLFLLVESQFQIEALFRNILSALGKLSAKQGFYNVAEMVLRVSSVSDPDDKLRVLNIAALMRNCMHANGIHYGYKGSDTAETVGGIEFKFQHGRRVQCGSWLHIVTALTASFVIIDEALRSVPVESVGTIPDVYAEQVALESG